MSADETVDTGSFSIVSKGDKNFALNVSTSMSLSLPENLADRLDAGDLRHQVKAGALWLTRARSCRLSLEVHFEHQADMSVHDEGQWRDFAIGAFQSCPVWRDLGLELRQELNVLQSSNRTHPETSVFQMQHIQQNAGLFVPQYVPCGYVSGISCSFRFTNRTSVPRTGAHTRYGPSKIDGEHSGPLSVSTAAIWGLPIELQSERVVHLSENALVLVLGMKRRCLGIRCLDGTKPLDLVELAPAVWNSQYFQNVVTRARLVPAISTTLGNMTSTQSPVLRRKIESLVAEPAGGSGLEDVLDELQKRTQTLLLRTTRDQKIKTCPPRMKSQGTQNYASTEGISLLNAFTSSDFSNYSNPDHGRETLHEQGEDSQPHEATSSFPGDCLLHLESESNHGFAIYQAGNAGGDGYDLPFEEDHMDNSMKKPGWIDDEMVSYTSERLLEPSSLHNEHYVRDEVLDLGHDQEYQEQRLAHDDFHQDDFYENSEIYGHYYEMSDLETRLQPFVHGFEDYSVQSNMAAGRLENLGDECSDFIGDEDDAMDDDICERLHANYFDEGEYGPWDMIQDYQGGMLHWGDVDGQAGPDRLTAGHVHNNDRAQAAENNTRLGWHGQVLED